MRIVVVGPTYPIRGGISHYTTAMVSAMRDRHRVLFLSYRKQYPDFLYPGRTQLDDSSEPLLAECEPLLSFANPCSWMRVGRRASSLDPDVLILSWVSPALAVQLRLISGLVARRSPRTSIAFICHNVAQHEHKALDGFLTRLAFRKGDSFIVHSAEDRDNLRALLPGAPVTKVALPSFDFFARAGVPREQARRELGLDPEAPVALYFGFVRPYKGLIHLLRALPAARRQVPGLRLLVVGEFWESVERYEMELAANGIRDSVTTVDRYVRNEEVATYFSAADLVVLPYVSATGSAIVQLAYGFNKPVLTTRVGGLPEAVEDGRTGYTVEPGDPGALAGAMVDFFKNDRGPEFARNIELESSRFSWDSLVEAIEATGVDGN